MNLFNHIQLYGNSKGFSREQGFFSSEFEVFKCSICGRKLEGIKRITCSKECVKEYRARKQKEGDNIRYHLQFNREIDGREFVLLMQEKYRVGK